MYSRNGSVTSPSTPGVFAVCLDLPPITEKLYALGIIFDARNCFLELPCSTIGRDHLEVEKCEDSTLFIEIELASA